MGRDDDLDDDDLDDDDLDDDDLDDDDLDDDDHPDLPPEAGQMGPSGFEPNDQWLSVANTRLQREAMRLWFCTRYWDPANDTPYNGAEGGYLFVNGGPYNAEDELYDRFGKLPVNDIDSLLRRVIDAVESDGIEEWAPIHHEREDEFDPRFALSVSAGSEPLQKLRDRLEKSREILTLQGNEATMELAKRLVFASAIGAVEAYLYELAYFWIDTDDVALRNVVKNLQEFRDEKISLGDIYQRLGGLKDHVKGRLQSIVWHRWDQVAQIYRAALGIRLPSVKELDAALVKRHHIVHRSGHDVHGTPITVTEAEIAELCLHIETFAEALEAAIASRSIDDPKANAAPTN